MEAVPRALWVRQVLPLGKPGTSTSVCSQITTSQPFALSAASGFGVVQSPQGAGLTTEAAGLTTEAVDLPRVPAVSSVTLQKHPLPTPQYVNDKGVDRFHCF